jgi:hypothetical protein
MISYSAAKAGQSVGINDEHSFLGSALDFMVYVFTLLFVVCDFFLGFTDSQNAIVQLQFMSIEILSIVFFALDRKPYSIHKFVMLYMLVFEGYAPLQQYRLGTNLWGVVLNTDELYLYSNLLVFLFLVVFEISYRLKRQRRIGPRCSPLAHIDVTSGVLVAFIILDVITVGYLAVTGQLIGKVSDEGGATYDTIRAALKIAVQMTCITTLFVYVLARRNAAVSATRGAQRLFQVTATISVCLVFFPFWGSMSRFLLFAGYIMLIVLLCPTPKYPSILLLLMLLGFVFVFPAFNFFKTHDFSDIAQFELSSGNFNHIDFDAHQCFMITIDYVSSRGLSLGMNLLSAILCFVPRTIWPGKWQPSGRIMFETYGASWTNVSCPIYAEFYFAFGVVGLLALTILLALAIRYVEESYERWDLFGQGICIILIGMTIYIMRGAMLPTFAYTFSVVIAFALCYLIAFIPRSLALVRSEQSKQKKMSGAL